MNGCRRKMWAVSLSSALALQTAPVQLLWAAAISSIDAVEVSPDQIRIAFTGPGSYKSFLLNHPARLVVEMKNARYKAKKKSFAGLGRYLKSVRAGQFTDHPAPVARVVVDFKSAGAHYWISKTSRALLIAFGPRSAEPSASSAPSDPPAPAVAAAVLPKARFLPALSKARRKAAAARDEGDVLGRMPKNKVDIDFDNTDIREVLKFMAARSGVNIVYGSDVSGSLTLHLSRVPFDEAFRTILAMMNLSMMQVGNDVLRILTPEALKKTQDSATTVTKVITLNYANATAILPEITAANAAQGIKGSVVADANTNSLIVTAPLEAVAATARLVKELDIRPQQVLIEVKLVEVSLNNSLNLGVQWDWFSAQNGKLFSQSGTNFNGTPVAPIAVTPPPTALNPTPVPSYNYSNLLQNPINTQWATGAAVPGGPTGPASALGAMGRGTGVNLPASTIFGALTLGRITSSYLLNMTLSAAAAEGKLKVLSDPKIATLNNQVANIDVTTKIPYVTTNIVAGGLGTQTQTVTYVTTGIQLSVTPTINADGRITLLLNPNVSQPSVIAAGNPTTGAPAVDSRTAQTTVLVRDGETIVIGGLIHDSVSHQINKIPLLGDIPLLGWLFKSKSVVRVRNELLIFVTPQILQD